MPWRLHDPACRKKYTPGVPLDVTRCQRCRDLLALIQEVRAAAIVNGRSQRAA
jgi:hypothetical protein